jgi:general secretion pathway protein H
MRTSAPGSSGIDHRAQLGGASGQDAKARGFTLLELLVVIAIIAIASAVSALALRDPTATRLEREALRLATLLDTARAQSRALGVPVQWHPFVATEAGARPNAAGSVPDFVFDGLPDGTDLPTRWLGTPGQPPVQVEWQTPVHTITLGPEPMVGAQRLVLRLQDQVVVLATDGLGPFAIADNPASP